ncbi:MAG: sulfatase-like hydrolase/transferase [Verrucomicrobiota bacterium]
MRRLSLYPLLLLATLLLILPTPAQDSSDSPSWRVMSFNIRYDNPKDGPNAWPKRKDFVVDTITSYNPHLLGLQEVVKHQGDFLQSKLPDYHFVGAGRNDGKDDGEFVPVMFRKDAFDLVDEGHFWLSESPDQPGSKSWDSSLPRIVTWTKLKPKTTTDAPTILFANTHFDHKGKQARLESAQLIRTKLQNIAGKDTPVIITGDFNTTESLEPYAVLVGSKPGQFIDSHRSAHPTPNPDESTATGFTAPKPGRRIDWILHSPHLKTTEAAINETISDEGRYPSDHFPVEATIQLKTDTPSAHLGEQREPAAKGRNRMQRHVAPAAKQHLDQAANASLARTLNVLFICTDDLRPMLGCYGDPVAQTPNIDRLAARGTLFNRAYCQSPQCGPSRVSFLTGLRPGTTRTYALADRFDWDRTKQPNLVTLPQHFKNHGYHAQAFGKLYHDERSDPHSWSVPESPGREREMWELVDEKAIADVPFKKRNTIPTVILPRDDCPAWQSPDVPDDTLFAGRMTTDAIATLKEFKDQPFFLAVGYRRPHLPFVAPKKYFDLYPKDKSLLPDPAHRPPPADAHVVAYYNSPNYAPKPGGNSSRWDPPPPRRVETVKDAIQWSGFELRSYNNIPNQGVFDDDLVISLRHAYLACVSYVDAQVGRLLDALEEEGLADNTIIVLTSDHGWHLGEHATWSKMTNFEWSARVPLIISAPDIISSKTDGLAELVDLYPTLAQLAKLPLPAQLEGDSLVPLMKNPTKKNWDRQNPAFTQYPRRNWAMGRAIRTDQYRYVEWRDKNTNQLIATELYDHHSDPAETQNLAHQKNQRQNLTTLAKRLHTSVPH